MKQDPVLDPTLDPTQLEKEAKLRTVIESVPNGT